MFEIGYDQGKMYLNDDRRRIFKRLCEKDLAGNDRVVTGML